LNHDRDRRDDRVRRHSYNPTYVYSPCYGYGEDYYPYAYPLPVWYSFGPGYGPQGVQQFMGLDNAGQPWPDGGVAQAARQADLADPPEPAVAANRATNEKSNAQAWKFIGYGDALFAKQKYAEANDRYRKAARSAPQLGAAWFRQGLALAAVGRCDLAAAAVKRGLKLDPAWPKSNFDLDQIFGPNNPKKDAMLDALAATVTAKPTDPNRLFVLGVCLHFDGQTGRAATLFERAEKIAGNNVGHIEAFLTQE
jgi:tetratricopeptide (TPR) repeat protein